MNVVTFLIVGTCILFIFCLCAYKGVLYKPPKDKYGSNVQKIVGSETPKETFKFFNPSIIRKGDNYHIIHRSSNYTFCSKVHPTSFLKSENQIYQSVYNENFNQITPKVLIEIPNDPSKNPINDKDDEDARIFTCPFGITNTEYILTNTRKYTEYNCMTLTNMNKNNSITFDTGGIEKNWIFLKDSVGDYAYIVTYFNPYTVAKVYKSGPLVGNIENVYTGDFNGQYKKLSGSTPIVNHPTLGFITLVHSKEGFTEYSSYWVKLSNTFPHKPVKISKKFCLSNDTQKCGIEFACGLTLDKNRNFIVTYGIWDCESFYSTFTTEEVSKMLNL